MKQITALLLVCVAALAQAHNEGEQAPMNGYDCEHPPSDAVTELPQILGRIGRLVCLPPGPAILANRGWTWRYTGSFFDLPQIPGYAHEDSMGMAPPFYFTKLATQQLNGDDAGKLSKELEQQLENYRPKSAPVELTVAAATNNYGKSIKIYVAMESENNGWLIVCAPQCRPDYVILVNKLQSN